MAMDRNKLVLKITYSLADQSFQGSISLGIFNISLGLVDGLAAHPSVDKLAILSNNTLTDRLQLSEKVKVIEDNSALQGTLQRAVWDQWGVIRAAQKSNNDWLFLPKGFGPFLFQCSVKLAVYIHDIMPVIYADRYPGSIRKWKQKYYQLCYAATLKKAKVVFTNTHFTQSEIERWAKENKLPCPPILVAGYGFALEPTVSQKENQILVLVREAAHKRTDIALSFVQRWLAENTFDGKVVCMGRLPKGVTIPDDQRWEFAGQVDSTTALSIMGRSRNVVHFSEYEGFGMPPVEAILVGTCPVYSHVGTSEEAMRGAGCAFQNDSYDSFAAVMSESFSISQDQIRSWATELISYHNWQNVIETVVTGLKQHQ